eukprot:TRINITY_DN28282_c0_g1_i3.p1 TRINITY_DN28282_c0_g1~~TRINITY_DN28282_c0_g1_i3.p1  ORF type:complete len:603 (+),score=175.94 TRINITY_DN28282_c0_g1_i3:84-1811(+)
MLRSLVGSEMCIRDSNNTDNNNSNRTEIETENDEDDNEEEEEQEPDKNLAELQYEQLAQLDDDELWDDATRKAWRSNVNKGIVKKDWEVNRPSLYDIQELGLVPLSRTVPSFFDIDLDGNGRINKREYLLHATAMMEMPTGLAEKLERQHGIKPGDHVRWIGKFEPPWNPINSDNDSNNINTSSNVAVVRRFGRDVQGRIFVLVASEGHVGPNVTDVSFGSGYLGRKVRVQDVEISDGSGRDLSVRVEQKELSAAAVFSMFYTKVQWQDGDDQDLLMLFAKDLDRLNLTPLIPPKERAEPMTRERFVALFHRYRFQQELFHAVVSLRTKDEIAKAEHGHMTSCMGSKYCLNPQDIKNFKLSLRDVAGFSQEFRRFGRLTMQKRIGFANTLALIKAMLARRERRHTLGENKLPPIQIPTPVQRLQASATAHEYLNSAGNFKPIHGESSTVKVWSAGINAVKISNLSSETLKQPRVPVLGYQNSTLQLVMFPAAEGLAWIRFLEQVATIGGGWGSDSRSIEMGNSSVGETESILRAQQVYVNDTTARENGHGFVVVTRCDNSGVLRLIVKASMFEAT